METVTIRYFMSVAKYQNFSQAAEENNISQSSFSKAIMRLERDLDVKLIDRSRHPIALTPAGKCFYDRMLTIGPLFQQAMEELSGFARENTVRLFICPQSYQYKIALDAFHQQEPGIQLQVEETSDITEVPRALCSGKYDFVISPRPFDLPENVNSTVLYDDALYLLTSSDFPLADRGEISLKELSGLNFYEAHYTKLLVLELARRFGFSPNFVYPTEEGIVRREEALHRISLKMGVGIYSSRELRPYRNSDMRCLAIREMADFPVLLMERSADRDTPAKRCFRSWITNNLVKYVSKRLDVEKFNRKAMGQ